MSYIPNYDENCDNSIEWSDEIEEQVEKEIIRISLDLSSYKPKEKETKLDIMRFQLKKIKKVKKTLRSICRW